MNVFITVSQGELGFLMISLYQIYIELVENSSKLDSVDHPALVVRTRQVIHVTVTKHSTATLVRAEL